MTINPLEITLPNPAQQVDATENKFGQTHADFVNNVKAAYTNESPYHQVDDLVNALSSVQTIVQASYPALSDTLLAIEETMGELLYNQNISRKMIAEDLLGPITTYVAQRLNAGAGNEADELKGLCDAYTKMLKEGDRWEKTYAKVKSMNIATKLIANIMEDYDASLATQAKDMVKTAERDTAPWFNGSVDEKAFPAAIQRYQKFAESLQIRFV